MIPGISSILTMRRRSVWEAADSGILLWRNNFFYFIPVFALPVWIAACALMFIPMEFRWVSFLALWWLKPLFDRLVLHIVSVRFFRNNSGSPPEKFRELLRGMAGMIFRGLPGDLLWRRFSPIRPAAMPLRLLERPGKQYNTRKKDLASGGLYFCVFLSCLGPVIELFLFGGELIFGIIIFELFFENAFWELSNELTDPTLFVLAIYCFNYILVESLYVCMGFGIYINSRTEVEGWDIQLLFEKFTGKLGSAAKTAAIVIGLLFFTLPLNAEDSPDETFNYFPESFLQAESFPHDELKEILASDDFGGSRPGWAVHLKNEQEPVRNLPRMEYSDWLRKLREIMASGLRAIIIIAIAGFAVFLFVKLRQSGRSVIKPWKGSVSVNPLLRIEDPETCFKKAESFFRDGILREAWAECFRGTIGAFSIYLNIFFPADATEYGCLDIVRSYSRVQSAEAMSVNTVLSAGFGDLVNNWILLAYGGRNPPEGSFEKAISFGRNIKTETSFGGLN